MVEQKIQQAIADFGMLNKMNGVLIGYSGGADSGALLYYMHKYAKEHNIYIAAVHINHCIRGVEADRDEAACRGVCAKLDIKLYVERVDVPKLAAEQGKGYEEVGRGVRYFTFHRLIEEHEELQHIALAHHAEDNMETVIFNMLRGSGTRGLAGIPPVRGERIIRPLIYCTKSEIIGYCIANDIPYVEDSTNSDNDYTRNYIRNEILPKLAHINPSPEISISHLCMLLRNDDIYIQEQASRIMSDNNIEYSCRRSQIAQQPAAISSRMIRYMYDRCAAKLYGRNRQFIMLDFNHIRSVSRMLYGGSIRARISLPQRICAAVEGDEFFFMGEDEYENAYQYSPDFRIPLTEGEHDVPEISARIMISQSPESEFEMKYKNIYKIFIHKILAFDKINGNLYIRNREPGDKIRSGGMTKLTKKLYCECKIPLDIRNLLPVLCDDDGIIWIPFMDCRDGMEIIPHTYRPASTAAPTPEGQSTSYSQLTVNNPGAQDKARDRELHIYYVCGTVN